MKKEKVYYAFFLIIGFLGLSLPHLFSTLWATGPLTLIWLFAFLELAYRFHTKRELLLTGAVFIIGNGFKLAGTSGYFFADLGIIVIVGLLVYAIFLISAYCMRRWNKFAVTLLFPALWTLVYIFATILRFPSMVRIDMMFTDLSAIIQAERLIGSYGFTFVIVWIVALLQFALSERKKWCAALGFGLLLAMLLAGIIALYPNTAAAESVNVAYTTGPYGGDAINYTDPSYETDVESLTRSIQDAAAQQAGLLVFNEEAFELEDSDEERFTQQCAALAAENSIAVLLGLDVSDTDGSEGGKSLNKIVLIDADGEIRDSYLKTQLIPVLESDYKKGDGNIPATRLELNGKSVKLAYLICYDSNFPEYVKRVEADTDILLLPSWDWSAVTRLHAELCRAIAVENQLYVLKPTYDGISVAIDPDGKVFHRSSTDENGYEHINIVKMPIRSTAVPVEDHTERSPFVYAIIGTDIFAMLICLALMICVLVLKTNNADNAKKTRRNFWFNVLLLTNIIACGSDALSWLFDGHTRLNTVVYCSTFLAMLLTIILVWEFFIYIFAYIKERNKVSRAWEIIANCIGFVAVVTTVITSLNGDLFTVNNAVYADGPKYGIYVAINIGMLIFAITAIIALRKSLTITGRIASYAYAVIPILSAAVNLFIEEWSFAYPATAITLLLIYIMIQSDELDRLEHEGEIIGYHATHDEMTGLYNRRAFEDRRAVLKETDGTCGVVFGDVNGLKYANDHYGHEAGDKLLIRFAAMLTGVFRQNEVFRISGDEFVCMVGNINESVFYQRLHNLEEALSRDAQPLACIGTTFGPNRDIDALIKEAEAKMYIEKDAFHARFPNTNR